MDWRAGMDEAALAALDAPIEPPTRSEEWSAEPAGRLGSAVEIDRVHGGWPSRVRIAGCTLEGARHYWLSIFKLEREYEPAELEAEVDASGAITVHVAKTLRLFEVLPPQPLAPGASLTVEGQRVPVGDAIFAGTTTCSSIERLVLFNKGYKAEPAPQVDWTILEDGGHGKQPAVCGPIDAAFASDFICVTGSGTPWDPAAEEWARESLRQFREAWRERGTGELRVVSDDEELSEAEVQGSNLILFGDPVRALQPLPRCPPPLRDQLILLSQWGWCVHRAATAGSLVRSRRCPSLAGRGTASSSSTVRRSTRTATACR